MFDLSTLHDLVDSSSRSAHTKISMHTVLNALENSSVIKQRTDLTPFFVDDNGFEQAKKILSEQTFGKQKSTQAKMLGALGGIKVLVRESSFNSNSGSKRLIAEDVFLELLLKHFTLKGWTLKQGRSSDTFGIRLGEAIRNKYPNLRPSFRSQALSGGLNLINLLLSLKTKETYINSSKYKFKIRLHSSTKPIMCFIGGLDRLFNTDEFSSFQKQVTKYKRANCFGDKNSKEFIKSPDSLYSKARRKKPSSFKLEELPPSDIDLLNRYLEFRTTSVNMDGSLRKKTWKIDRSGKCHTYIMMVTKLNQFFGYLKDEKLIAKNKAVGLWILTDVRYFKSYYQHEVARGVSPSTLEKHVSWIMSFLNPEEFFSNKHFVIESFIAQGNKRIVNLNDIYQEYAKIFSEVEKRCRNEGRTNDSRDKMLPFLKNTEGPVGYLKKHVLDNLDNLTYTVQSSIKQKEKTRLIISMLLEKPFRTNALISIKLSDLSENSQGRYEIILPSSADKNNLPRKFTYSTKVTQLIKDYVLKYRPRPTNRSYNELFLEESGRPHIEGSMITTMVKQISAQASRVTLEKALHVTPHLMRHICATQYLMDNPKDYNSCAHLLGDTLEKVIESYSFLEGSKFQDDYVADITRRIEGYECIFNDKGIEGTSSVDEMFLEVEKLESKTIRNITRSDLKGFFEFLEVHPGMAINFNESFRRKLVSWSNTYQGNTAASKRSRVMRIARTIIANKFQVNSPFPIYKGNNFKKKKVNREPYGLDWKTTSIARYCQEYLLYKKDWSQAAAQNFKVRSSLVCGFMNRKYGSVDFERFATQEFYEDYKSFLEGRGNKTGDAFGKFVCEWVLFVDHIHIKLLKEPFLKRNPIYSYGKQFRRDDTGNTRHNMKSIEDMMRSFEVPAEPILKLIAFLKSKSGTFLNQRDIFKQWEVLKSSGLVVQKAQETGVDEIFCYLGFMVFKPLRLKNLCEDLAWGANLKIINSRVQLFIPRNRVKNNKDIRFTFPDWLSEAIRCLAIRKRLKDGDNLFSVGKKQISLSATFQTISKKFLGLEVNPHSFRHIMVTNYLTLNKEDYVGASIICNHDIKTMLEYYSKVNYELSLSERAERLWS